MPTTAATSRKSNSWRTSASRRSRQPTSSAGIDNSTYKLNPYKNNRITTTINNKGKGGKGGLRNSGGNSNNPQVRGVIIDDDDKLHNDNNNNNSKDSKKEDINLLNDILNSDDDDLGLDNILSSISDNKSISDVNINVNNNNIQSLANTQDNKEADSNNIISTIKDDILPSSLVQQPTIATNNNGNNNSNNIRLPSNNSRNDINRLSDTTPPIQNASSNISSGANKIEGSSSSPPQHQQHEMVSNISSRALNFDIENDIIIPTSSNIIQDVDNKLFPIPVRNDVKSNSELLDGSDKRVPSSENIIPHGKFVC